MAEVVHIGHAATLTGISVDTIRFYQKRGLLENTPRSPGGYRLFTDCQIRDLTFVRHAQALGFSLNEIKELLSLRQREHVCPDVQMFLEQKLKDVQEKIKALVHLEKDLDRVLRNCKRQRGKQRHLKHDGLGCPLLAKLEQPNSSNGKHAAKRSSTEKK